MTIIWPSNTKEIIDKIRGTIGRDITIHYPSSGITCSACATDPFTGNSIDPYCTVCGGDGIVTSGLEITISAHILWNRTNSHYNATAGEIFTGDCKATIDRDIDNIITIIETADYFLVDDEKLYLESYDPRGVQEINRLALQLKQDPREGR
jgi:hypothetical protein